MSVVGPKRRLGDVHRFVSCPFVASWPQADLPAASAAAFRPRLVVDGGDVRVRYRGLCDRFSVPARFSMGWYAGRVYGLISGSLLLFALLYEITALYGQLLRANLAQRREREARLMTGDAVAAAMAHEINQPLSAMITNADTAVRWLDLSMPDIDKAKAALKRVAANGRRAGHREGSRRITASPA
jgi:hypothetical protein